MLSGASHPESHVICSPMSVVGNKSRMRKAMRHCLALGVVVVAVGLFFSCQKESVLISEPFSIVNRTGSWAFVNAAIAAAEPGDTVVIDQDGEVPYSPLVISVPLRLQAAPNRKPLFVSTADNASFIRAEAPMVLEGLTFMLHILERKRCPSLIEARAPLAVTNCCL
jgi:hypothetical protein